jgi:hypothetical protein
MIKREFAHGGCFTRFPRHWKRVGLVMKLCSSLSS